MNKVRLSARELTFVKRTSVCRIATLSDDGWPHCVPVGYLYRNGRFYIPTNKSSQKIRNLKANPRASIIIDDSTQTVLMIQGLVEIVDGHRFSKLRRWMTARTGWTMDALTGAMLVLTPLKKATWKPSG